MLTHGPGYLWSNYPYQRSQLQGNSLNSCWALEWHATSSVFPEATDMMTGDIRSCVIGLGRTATSKHRPEVQRLSIPLVLKNKPCYQKKTCISLCQGGFALCPSRSQACTHFLLSIVSFNRFHNKTAAFRRRLLFFWGKNKAHAVTVS